MASTGKIIDAVLGAAIQALCDRVVSFLSDPILSFKDFTRKSDKLAEAYETISAMLEDAEKTYVEDEAAKLWLQRLRRLGSDIYKLREEISVKLRAKVRIFPLPFCKRIDAILAKLEEIRRDAAAFPLRGERKRSRSEADDDRHQTSSFTEKSAAFQGTADDIDANEIISFRRTQRLSESGASTTPEAEETALEEVMGPDRQSHVQRIRLWESPRTCKRIASKFNTTPRPATNSASTPHENLATKSDLEEVWRAIRTLADELKGRRSSSSVFDDDGHSQIEGLEKGMRVKLLDHQHNEVALGEVVDTNPKSTVIGGQLGRLCVGVRIDSPIQPDVELENPVDDYQIVGDAMGLVVKWNKHWLRPGLGFKDAI